MHPIRRVFGSSEGGEGAEGNDHSGKISMIVDNNIPCNSHIENTNLKINVLKRSKYSSGSLQLMSKFRIEKNPL